MRQYLNRRAPNTAINHQLQPTNQTNNAGRRGARSSNSQTTTTSLLRVSVSFFLPLRAPPTATVSLWRHYDSTRYMQRHVRHWHVPTRTDAFVRYSYDSNISDSMLVSVNSFVCIYVFRVSSSCVQLCAPLLHFFIQDIQLGAETREHSEIAAPTSRFINAHSRRQYRQTTSSLHWFVLHTPTTTSSAEDDSPVRSTLPSYTLYVCSVVCARISASFTATVLLAAKRIISDM